MKTRPEIKCFRIGEQKMYENEIKIYNTLKEQSHDLSYSELEELTGLDMFDILKGEKLLGRSQILAGNFRGVDYTLSLEKGNLTDNQVSSIISHYHPKESKIELSIPESLVVVEKLVKKLGQINNQTQQHIRTNKDRENQRFRNSFSIDGKTIHRKFDDGSIAEYNWVEPKEDDKVTFSNLDANKDLNGTTHTVDKIYTSGSDNDKENQKIVNGIKSMYNNSQKIIDSFQKQLDDGSNDRSFLQGEMDKHELLLQDLENMVHHITGKDIKDL